MNPSANIDFCGIVMLLRELKASGIFTDKEIEKIATRVRTELGATIILDV